jgi:hypothetical protein
MRTSFKLRNDRTEIEKSTKEKYDLVKQCEGIEKQILKLRKETTVRQRQITDAEENLRHQQQQQQRRRQQQGRQRESQNNQRQRQNFGNNNNNNNKN